MSYQSQKIVLNYEIWNFELMFKQDWMADTNSALCNCYLKVCGVTSDFRILF